MAEPAVQDDAPAPPPAEPKPEAEAQPAPEKKPAAKAAPKKKAAAKQADLGPDAPKGGYMTVRDRYHIFYEAPLPDLDMPHATAYQVIDRKQKTRVLFALVCQPQMLARVSVMRVLKGNQIPHMLHMVDWGAAEWPPADRKCIIIIYERPSGGRVMDSLSSRIDRVPDHQFPKIFIEPLVQAIKELSMKGITHRSIRPDNIYWQDESRQRVVLGDCVTCIPGHDQPAVFETIEMGAAMPAGRGAGKYPDDMYALGVTLLMFALGHNPVLNETDNELSDRKIKEGTYAALVGDERLPVQLIECFRALLSDDEEQRWNVDNLDLWLNGRRLTPIQTRPAAQAQRSLEFAGKEYHALRPLAVDMHRNWEEARKIIADGSLEIWIRRGLENNDLADAIDSAIKNAQAIPNDAGSSEDVLVARILMLMDPDMPIRMPEITVHLEGFGAAMGRAMLTNQNLTPYTDFINKELARFWGAAQVKYNPDHGQYEQVFKDLKEYLKDPASGAGAERCVYELNEWIQCLSPIMETEMVMEVKNVLPALDSVAKSANSKMWPVDRHIAAFARARYAKGTGPQIDAMNDDRADKATIGMLSVLAILQWRLGPDAVYNLCSWVGGLMGPVINSYHNRMRRKELEKEIPRLVRKGNLPEMYNYLDNPEERQRDTEGFAWAKAEYAAAEKQIHDLEHGKMDRDESAVRMGKQTAAVAATIIAALVYAVIMLGELF